MVASWYTCLQEERTVYWAGPPAWGCSRVWAVWRTGWAAWGWRPSTSGWPSPSSAWWTCWPPPRTPWQRSVMVTLKVIPGPGIAWSVVCWLLNVPATGECISGTDLLRQFYVLPHWDRSCRSNVLPHPVTVYWHRADQSQCWPYIARRLAG